jgi:hypothetical protein
MRLLEIYNLMGKITEELLRKRAEHNEGILSTLEEVRILNN